MTKMRSPRIEMKKRRKGILTKRAEVAWACSWISINIRGTVRCGV
jgi:hypothetical protein